MQTNHSGKWFQLHIPHNWNNFTIDNILKEEWKVPKKLLHEIRMDKGVRLNGEYVNWNTALKTNDLFEIAIYQDEDYGVVPQDLSIEVLYEDDHLIIVNKPAGIDTHPNIDGQKGTLANGVAYYFQEKNECHRVRHIHRLDRDTSGAILFAKHSLSHAILDRLLNERKIKRTYYALVQGLIKKPSFVIDNPIGRDRHHPTRRRVSTSGQTAITRVTVLNVFPKEKYSLIECSLDTGRTHQIRVHLSSIGHPLVGDTLYGGKPVFNRQALHARKLAFVHPFLGKKVECIAPFNDESSIFEKFT